VKGYFYVADETGAEVEGSRRSLAHCRYRDEAMEVWRELQRLAGEGCEVKDSEFDRRVEPAQSKE